MSVLVVGRRRRRIKANNATAKPTAFFRRLYRYNFKSMRNQGRIAVVSYKNIFS